MMAYQGKDNLVGKSMTEVQDEFVEFRKRTSKPKEKVAFAVIAGDFNIDNISPCTKKLCFSRLDLAGGQCYDFC
jgi:hypothetical protein